MPPDERLAETVEAAVYFVVAEALTNVVKHAEATEVRVRSVAPTATLAGRDRRRRRRRRRRSSEGSGLRGLADRVEALGGRLVVSSPVGEGTAVRAQLPVG